MDTKIEIQITVIRTSMGIRTTATATVTAEQEAKGIAPLRLADKLGTKALREVAREYGAVSKALGPVKTEET